MGAGGDKPLNEYLRNLGLTDDELVPETKPVTKEEAIEKAQKILELAKKKATSSPKQTR